MWILAIVASMALVGGSVLSIDAHDRGWPDAVRYLGSAVAVFSLVPVFFGWMFLAADSWQRWREAKRRARFEPVFPDARVVHEPAARARRA
jgi:hypothetical protein